MSELSDDLQKVYEAMEGSDASSAYSERHGIASLAVLTVTDDEIASLIALHLAPRIVSFLFGAADEFVGNIKGDIAIYCTHSDVNGMRLVAAQFAPIVVDVYGEIIAESPKGFDPLAVALRKHA